MARRLRLPLFAHVMTALIGAALAALCSSDAVRADELLKLEGRQAAIVFVVDGQGRGGEMLVRDQKQPAPIWASLLSASSVRQFIVRPGPYNLVLAPDTKAVAVATSAGRATILWLSGAAPSGAYRLRGQNDVAASEIDGTEVATFITERQLAPAGYAPTALEARGAGLTFVLRADF